jgi:cytidine deaminase
MTKSERIQELMTLAGKVRERAYAPYSGFRMGAAVDTEKGILLPGSLVENVSLGLAMCAERVALFSTIAQGAGRPTTLVLVAERTNGRFTFPCGACLQVALELGGPELQVIACDPEGKNEAARLGDLAPQLPYKGNQRAE